MVLTDKNDKAFYCIVMERPEKAVDLLCHLNSIRNKSEPPFSETEILGIVKKLLEISKELKKRGIFNADLKLDNVLYNRDKRQVTVIDLGNVLRYPKGGRPFKDRFLSTPCCAPPEMGVGGRRRPHRLVTYEPERYIAWNVALIAFELGIGWAYPFKYCRHEDINVARCLGFAGRSPRFCDYLSLCLEARKMARRPGLDQVLPGVYTTAVRPDNGPSLPKSFPKKRRLYYEEDTANEVRLVDKRMKLYKDPYWYEDVTCGV